MRNDSTIGPSTMPFADRLDFQAGCAAQTTGAQGTQITTARFILTQKVPPRMAEAPVWEMFKWVTNLAVILLKQVHGMKRLTSQLKDDAIRLSTPMTNLSKACFPFQKQRSSASVSGRD